MVSSEKRAPFQVLCSLIRGRGRSSELLEAFCLLCGRQKTLMASPAPSLLSGQVGKALHIGFIRALDERAMFGISCVIGTCIV